MIKIINFFAGPGAGKSTISAGLFYKFKKENKEVELVTEFVKDIIFESGFNLLDNQLYIFANQQHKIFRIIQYYKNNNVKEAYIITDSPILLGVIYNKNNDKYLNDLIIAEFNYMRGFNIKNINIFIERNPYNFNQLGRIQNKEESIKIDNKIINLLKENNIDFFKIKYNINIDELYNKIINQKF